MNIFEDTAPSSPRRWPLRVAVMGASGSIGTQTLDVCRKHPDKLRVTALSVHSSCDLAVRAAREFGASHVYVSDEGHAHDASLEGLPRGCELRVGGRSLEEVAWLDDVDVVVNALVGFAGIRLGHESLRAHKILTYANKESLVVGGDLLMPLAQPGRLLPIDSEHSAIYQCLVGERRCDVHKVWLTCSGGPFFGMGRDELAKVTAADALKHPTWSMGPKITIDSATLMNKGLEVLEAHHLFDVDVDDVNVLVHRQSTIHSMVEFSDGVVKAQLGLSDMRIPIQYALSYPERWETPSDRVEYRDLPDLSFSRPDEGAFGCLGLARRAGRAGGTLPCVMNAANEVANLAFRRDECGFLDIERVVREVMDAASVQPVQSVEQLEEVDRASRASAHRVLEGLR